MATNVATRKRLFMAKGIYGEGTFSEVTNRPNAPIRYRKRILGKYVSVYGKSERECIKKMKEKESQLLEKEKLMHPSDIEQCALFKDAVLFWLETYRKGKLKGRSFDRNMQIFHTYIEEMPIGRMSIDNIGSNDIQSLLNEVSYSRSQSTVNKVHGLLNQFFEHYYKRDSNNNPMLLVDKPQKQIDYSVVDAGDIDNNKVLSDEEIELLTKELTKPYQNGIGGYKCGYMLLFIMWSYVRIGEALGLKYGDIANLECADNTRCTMRISREYSQEMNYDTGKKEWKLTTPKSKHAIRTVPLSSQAQACLKEHIKLWRNNIEASSFVFQSENGNPISLQHLNKKLKQALVNAGITKDISLHGLRHTGISYYIRHGVDISLISRTAGHSDISTTMKIYYNIIEEQKMSMFDHIA